MGGEMADGERRQGRDPAVIRDEIERARADIAGSVLVLRGQLTAATDWRAWARRHPAPVLFSALAFGFWLGFRRREPLPAATILLGRS